MDDFTDFIRRSLYFHPGNTQELGIFWLQSNFIIVSHFLACCVKLHVAPSAFHDNYRVFLFFLAKLLSKFCFLLSCALLEILIWKISYSTITRNTTIPLSVSIGKSSTKSIVVVSKIRRAISIRRIKTIGHKGIIESSPKG